MTLRITILLIFFSLISSGQKDCGKFVKEYIPINLNESLEYLECKWNQNDLEKFKKLKKDQDIEDLNLSNNILAIYKDFDLWNQNSKLCKSFFELGIFEPQDMNHIILTSLHRKLNNKDIQLELQVKNYLKYYDEMERKGIERMKNKFQKYKIGDSVSFSYKHYFISRPNDCVAKGIVIALDTTGLKLKVEIKENCEEGSFTIRESRIYEKTQGKLMFKGNEIINVMQKGKTIWTTYNLWKITE